MGTKTFRAYLAGKLSSSTGVASYAALNPAGDAVGKATVSMIIPDDFGDVHGDDDNLAVTRAQTRAAELSAPLVFPAGEYTITEPIVGTSNSHIVILPGATIVAHPTDFVGDSLIEFGSMADKAFNFSISGGGNIDGNNIADIKGVDTIWGYRGYIKDLRIFGCPGKPIHVGATGTSNSSYEVHTFDCKIFNGGRDDVAIHNDPASIGIHYENATDCTIRSNQVIGYYRGIRWENASITLIDNHVWNRDTHGPLYICYDGQGRTPILTGNYADNPTVYDPDGVTLTDCYAFYLHGILPMMSDNHIIIATGSTALDNTVTAIYMDQEVFGNIISTTFEGGVNTTLRYKSFFSGGSNGTRFCASLFPSSLRVVDTASIKSIETPSSSGAISYYRAVSVFADDLIVTDRFRVENSLGIEILANGSGNSDIVFKRADATNAFILRTDTSGNINFSRRDAAGAAVDVPWVISNATGITTMAKAVNFTTEATTIAVPVFTLTSTTAALAAIGNAINTTGKVAGLTVWDSTSKLWMRASGSTAGAVWEHGATTVTPV